MTKTRTKVLLTNNESEVTMGSSLNNLTSSVVKPTTTSSATSSVNSSSSTTLKSDIIVKPSTVTVKPAVVTAKNNVNTNVSKLEKLLTDYEAAVPESMISDRKFKSMDVMINICEYLNRTNDPAVFEYFFRYFQRHQNDIMHYETALRGIHLIQNKMVKTRVSSTHACYLELCRVRGSKNKVTYSFGINAMKLMYISETQGKWIIEKSKNRQ